MKEEEKEEEYYVISHAVAKSDLTDLFEDVQTKINMCILDLHDLEIGLADKDYKAAKNRIAYLDSLVDTAHTISQLLVGDVVAELENEDKD
jgi:hypothetical protein